MRSTSFTDMFPQDEADDNKGRRKPVVPINIIAPKIKAAGGKDSYTDLPEKQYNKVIDSIDMSYENSPHARYLIDAAINNNCSIVLTTMGVSGYFHPQTNQLLMNYKYSSPHLVNVLGHELGHHEFFQNGGKDSFSSFCDHRTGLNALKTSEADATSSEGLVALQMKKKKIVSPWVVFKKQQPIVSEKIEEYAKKHGIEDVVGIRNAGFIAWYDDKINIEEAEKSRELYLFSSLIPYEQRHGLKDSWFRVSVPESELIKIVNHHGIPYISNPDKLVESRKFLAITKNMLAKIEKFNNIRTSLYGAEPDLSAYTLPIARERIIQPPTLVASTKPLKNKIPLRKGTSR